MFRTPVAGRKPKPEGQARHRNKAQTEWVEVVDQPFSGAPALPKRNRGSWPARIKRKWATWSSMPHCVLWSPADWEFAMDTLEIAAQFYEGDTKAATELRNREKVLGTTADYRRDLRIRYVDHSEQEAASEDVPNISDYRTRAV